MGIAHSNAYRNAAMWTDLPVKITMKCLCANSRFPFYIGYCNGYVGYLPTQQSHSEGGYEIWATPLDPVAGKIFVKGIEKLLLNLY
jgi:hypothetical protein